MKKLAYSILAYVCLVANLAAQNTDVLFPLPNTEGKWGYVDANKKPKISFQFTGASPFYEERAFVGRVEGDKKIISVIDTKGNILFDAPFVATSAQDLYLMDYLRYSEGLLPIPDYSDEKKCVYWDKAGKVALEIPNPQKAYMTHHQFSDGLAYIRMNDSLAMYVDKTGKKVLDAKAPVAPLDNEFQSGWATECSTLEQANYTYINKKGEQATFLKKFKTILDLGAMREGIAFMALGDEKDMGAEAKIFLLKPDGTTIPMKVKLGYSSPVTTVTGYHFSEGLALVRRQGELMEDSYVYLNTKGEIAFDVNKIIKKNANAPQIMGKGFYKGLACWQVMVSDNTFKVVYLDKTGKIAFESPIIKYQYE